MALTDATNDGLRRSMDDAGIDLSIFAAGYEPTRIRYASSTKLPPAPMNIGRKPVCCRSAVCIRKDTNYKEELRHIADMGVKGIKRIRHHQGYDFDDIGYMRIIDKAAELGLIVSTHAGMDIGIPEHNDCSTAHIRHATQEVGPDKLVLAHMGGWQGWRDVANNLADLPVYFDTAFSMGDILPAPNTTRAEEESHNMNKQQFAFLAHTPGTDKLLFATDCPWSSQSESLAFLRDCEFTEQELADILGNNAQKLLKL